MATVCACGSDEAFQELVQASQRGPVVLFKHSTRCPVSAAARRAVCDFAAAHDEVPCFEVLVVEQRPLSQAIAAETGIAHQSPQVILFRDGQPVWHTSHFNISTTALEDAIQG